MKSFRSCLLFLLIVCLKAAFCKIHYDYYWREYKGEIPHDAVAGGYDSDNHTTYIGQAYIKEKGIIPVTIYPGQKWVKASIQGVHTIGKNIKILCTTSAGQLKWLTAYASDIQVAMLGNHLVRGGVEYGLITNIGRVSYQGQVVVGKVCGFNIGDAKMFFPFNNEEQSVSSYEVLVYKQY